MTVPDDEELGKKPNEMRSVSFSPPPRSAGVDNLSDSDDENFSTFLEFLANPNPTEIRHNPQRDIASGGAKLISHLLHKDEDIGEEEEEEEEEKKDGEIDNVTVEAAPPSLPTTSGGSPTKDYNALIKEKQAAKKKSSKKKGKKKKSDIPPAKMSQVLSFLPTTQDKTLLCLGLLFGFLNGLVYPILAYVFSNSFSDLGNASQGLENVRSIAFTFLGVGAYAFVVAAAQNFFFLIVAHRAADNFKKRWFAALLRQDAAFHDVHSISGMATALSSASNKMKRGLGRKLGEGIQFGTTFIGGIVYAFYASWQVALVILGLLPVVSVSAFALMQLNQNQTSSAQKVSVVFKGISICAVVHSFHYWTHYNHHINHKQAYTSAGSVAYGAVSSIRTVYSLNAVPEMIRQYSVATMEAYRNGVRPLVKIGLIK